ncbi:MAG TPA: type II toxin-antitoxin system VapC family toxin [Ramlibacter sp.]|uniref:type II toxin-antitoxin system VapC family toxin n=1 Tax=Ramlibacter sp. TaxID=1917967 RepID=UPI002C5AE522|nr:type II toxin-antitoxin system VapC family toxin [Ramlibacter sp.]HVZ42514.1 type II toxin-antitoxin system VapC family toxin [Ramlibacter sp.]
MIALDTNVVARFYVDDPADPDAEKQRPAARRVFEESKALFIPLTVVIELEWVMRAFYEFTPAQFAKVIRHLAGLPHLTMEGATVVLAALQDHLDGLDFTDALHLRSSARCESLASFDERKFARRAKRKGLKPPVVTP